MNAPAKKTPEIISVPSHLRERLALKLREYEGRADDVNGEAKYVAKSKSVVDGHGLCKRLLRNHLDVIYKREICKILLEGKPVTSSELQERVTEATKPLLFNDWVYMESRHDIMGYLSGRLRLPRVKDSAVS